MTHQLDITEGLGRGREDDEYHVPDDMRQKHTIRMKLSKDGGPIQHKQMDVKTLHGAEHAKNFAHDQARKQGWTVHEETEVVEAKVAATATVRAGLAARGRKEPSEAEKAEKKKEHDDAWERLMAHAAAKKNVAEGAYGPYEKAQENKRSADSAKKHGDNFAYHLHMADHHDNLAQWHGEKGRHGEADRHAEKSEKHHEEAMKLKEEVAANNVGGGNIAGTQGDAGKKAVMTKEPLKRKKLKDFKQFDEETDKDPCWKNYKMVGMKDKNGKKVPNCVPKESVEIDEAAIDAKGHKSSTGGLTQKGRDYYNNKTGGNLQAPVTTPPSKLDPDSKAAKRRKSFCARMSGVDGPMKDENGKPTRKALALRKWNC